MNIKVQCWNLRRKCFNKLRHRKKIALTFDDGHKYADQILEKLEQYGVKSTFFCVGLVLRRTVIFTKKYTMPDMKLETIAIPIRIWQNYRKLKS